MTAPRKGVSIYARLGAELWRAAAAEAREDIPMPEPREGQLLAWILADFLGRELRVTGDYTSASPVYHTATECHKFPADPKLVDGSRSSARTCAYCAGVAGDPEKALRRAMESAKEGVSD